MSLRFPATRHSWQATFQTRSFAQRFTRVFGRCKQWVAYHRSCEFSNSARSLAPRKTGSSQTSNRANPKSGQTLIFGSRKPTAYEPLTEKLALRTSPTLLYQASSYSNYVFGCYAVGGGLLAAGWFNFQTQFYVRPGGVPQWVPAFTSAGSFLIACGGFWMLLKVRRTVSQGVSAIRLTPDVSHTTWFGP